jgi:hypothetical protein
MNFEDTIHGQDLLDLIQRIDAWEIPERDYAKVVNEQLRLQAGLEYQLSGDLPQYPPFASLRF